MRLNEGEQMASIFDFTDSKNRVNYARLKDYVAGISLSEFTDKIQYLFLVGKELYDGEMSRQINASSTSTMRFSAAAVKEILAKSETKPSVHVSGPDVPPKKELSSDTSRKLEPPSTEESSLSKAIYIIRKRPFAAETNQNLITVGRAMDNDIVIADYVISKHHAQIVLFKGMHFILDSGSTNGTSVNYELIKPGMKMQLQPGATIAFGRICFVLAHPLSIYRGMRKEILGL